MNQRYSDKASIDFLFLTITCSITCSTYFLFFLPWNFQNEQESANTLDETVTEETPLSPKQSLHNAFTIKDLSSLVNNLEAEITLNEQHLKDENDKRYMFKVSDKFTKYQNTDSMSIFRFFSSSSTNRLMIVVVLTIMMNLFVHFYRCLPNVEYLLNWWHNNYQHHESLSIVSVEMAIVAIKSHTKKLHKKLRAANAERDVTNMQRKNDEIENILKLKWENE